MDILTKRGVTFRMFWKSMEKRIELRYDDDKGGKTEQGQGVRLAGRNARTTKV